MKIGFKFKETVRYTDQLSRVTEWMVVSILNENECLVYGNYWDKDRYEVKLIKDCK